jgi:predicted nucleic acid-binding protein
VPQTYLLGTSTFSDLMRKHPVAVAHLASSINDKVRICPIVRGEILHGLDRLPQGRKRRELAQIATALFTDIPCEALSETVADHYAQLKLAAQKRGRPVDENDLWIAVTALALDAVLVTRDSDYQSISGLGLVDWSK